MELENKGGTAVPSLQKQVGTRLGKVADKLETRTYAAKVAGVSADMLRRYIEGSSKQSFEAVARLCAESGASMEWVWTGSGAMETGDNRAEEGQGAYQADPGEGYLKALKLCEEVLQAKQMNLPPQKKVDLVQVVAHMISNENEQTVKSNIIHLVKLAS